MNNKIVLAMIASGAAGKTTLRRMITNQDAGAEKHYELHDCFYANRFSCCGLSFKTKDEVLDHLHSPMAEGAERVNHQPGCSAYVPYNVGWTTFANGTAVCGLNGKDGHPGTGADSNGNVDAVNYAIDKCLEVSDFVIFDGVMSSKRLVAHLATHPCPNLAVIWVYLNVSTETVLERLLARREGNGEADTSEKTKRGVLNFHRRAEKMWKFINENYAREPHTLVEIPEGPSPAAIYQFLQPIIRSVATERIAELASV
jgi:deoxyadenosine/deoxycytidine kinase